MYTTHTLLSLKDQLLNPKRSDKFQMPFYLEGWRICDVSIGSKKCRVVPITKRGGKTFTLFKLKEQLQKHYWTAAKTDATIKAWSNGKRKRPRNWEKDYA
jgi:hypothetical protein|tara:strand:- start:41 stop:340 length:300 start_codon:yes stop_codon:yes gene_type:complete